MLIMQGEFLLRSHLMFSIVLTLTCNSVAIAVRTQDNDSFASIRLTPGSSVDLLWITSTPKFAAMFAHARRSLSLSR